MSSVDDRYKAALIEEHDSYVRSGRTEDAKGVARVLKDQYDHDVSKKDDSGSEDKPKLASTLPENAAAEKPAEDTAEPKSRRTTRAKLQGESK